LHSSRSNHDALSNAVICHPPIGFSEGYSFAYLFVDEDGKQECVRGISSTSAAQVSMRNSDVVTLYLNCRQESDAGGTINDRTEKFVMHWKVLYYGDRSGNISLVTPCPPCGAYTMQGGWALKNVGEGVLPIAYKTSSLATFDTTSNNYSYSEGNCFDVATTASVN
jgi:hypothetical protein